MSAPSSVNANHSVPTPLASVAWQEQGRLLVASHPLTMAPFIATRVYALLGVAQYGAVVRANKHGKDDGESEQNSERSDDRGRQNSEAERGAIAAASTQILSYIFTDAAATLEQRLTDEGNAVAGRDRLQFARGVAVGRAFGNVMIAWANSDGYSVAWTGSIPVGSGFWTRNPAVPPATTLPALAGPQFGAIKPYFLTSGSQFHPRTPPAFGSTAFLTDLAEVSTFAVGRTPAQLAISVFWNLPNGTATALGYWDALASQYIVEHRLGERDAAHIFALTSAAGMDAIIGCWEAKYSYFYIRPYQVDQVTYPISTPIGRPNHPSYPSGHSCVSAAAGEVIKHFFPDHARTVDDQVAEAGLSRIYAGIHYRFDVTAGQELGRAAAKVALKYDRKKGLLAAVTPSEREH
jgi:membrane-associated phospholipid phosphatase